MFRSQSIVILLGLAVPLGGNVLSIYNLIPLEGLDITPMCFVTSGLLFAVSIFKYDFLNIPPDLCGLGQGNGIGLLILDGPAGLEAEKRRKKHTHDKR